MSKNKDRQKWRILYKQKEEQEGKPQQVIIRTIIQEEQYPNETRTRKKSETKTKQKQGKKSNTTKTRKTKTRTSKQT